MTTKRSLKNDVEQLQNRTVDEQNSEVSYYKHPETGDLYDRYKTVVDNPTGIVILQPWYMAPFVVEREKAEAEGWEIEDSTETPDDHYSDLVVVSEWCVNPWVEGSGDREIVAEQ